MADTGKQSPLGVNTLAGLINDTGIRINPIAESYMGISRSIGAYSFGKIVEDTCLRMLTYSINTGTQTDTPTYNNMIHVGEYTIPGLGNSPPATYTWALRPKWVPYYRTNPSSPNTWGYIRLFALQAWNEFNFNSTYVIKGEYRDFLSAFMSISGFIDYSNTAITAMDNSKTYLNGTFSNMNDLISADVTGVSLSTGDFGTDLLNSGKVIDLTAISSFGLPSSLVQTLAKNNALTPSVSLALLAAGLSAADVSDLTAGVNTPPRAQQTQIYNAFKLIKNQDLKDVLVQLNCATTGITVLTDLLDVRKLFPTSLTTLSVPVYNTSSGGSSKTSYHIYSGSSINSQITTSAIKSQIGQIILPGAPEVTDDTTLTSSTPRTGFGSYLDGIVMPEDVIVGAGAFSASMQQIRNLASVPIEKFAQIVVNIETVTSLSAATATNAPAPTNQSLVSSALPKIALGSGPQGTYTMSNFLGCMSGLPYDWLGIYNDIRALEDKMLYDLYRELFLAVNWSMASTIAITEERAIRTQEYVPGKPEIKEVIGKRYDPPRYKYAPPMNLAAFELWEVEPKAAVPAVPPIPALYRWDYRITGFCNDFTAGATHGGGYGRMGAVPPDVTISSPNAIPGFPGTFPMPNPTGVKCKTTIMKSNGYKEDPATFGKVMSYSGGSQVWVPFKLDVPGQLVWNYKTEAWEHGGVTPQVAIMTEVVVKVETPPKNRPDFTKAYPFGKGTNNPNPAVPPDTLNGWPWMNTPAQDYLTRANGEIESIKNSNASRAGELNLKWGSTGTQLTAEQRSINTGHTLSIPLDTIRDDKLSTFPTVQYSFVDSLPTYAKNIKPHMYAQTLEAISDLTSTSGQSLVGVMRESRNQDRLLKAGISLDNNILGELTPRDSANLISSGMATNIVPGTGIMINGVENSPPAQLTQYSLTATLGDTTPPVLADRIAGIISVESLSPITVSAAGFTRFDPVTGSNIHRVTAIKINNSSYSIGGGGPGASGSTGGPTILGPYLTQWGLGRPNVVMVDNPSVVSWYTDNNLHFATDPPGLRDGDTIVFPAGEYISSVYRFRLDPLIPNQTYTIKSLGTTNFMDIGAASNTVGVSFRTNSSDFTGTGVLTGEPFRTMMASADMVAGQEYIINQNTSIDWVGVGASSNALWTRFTYNGSKVIRGGFTYVVKNILQSGPTYYVRNPVQYFGWTGHPDDPTYTVFSLSTTPTGPIFDLGKEFGESWFHSVATDSTFVLGSGPVTLNLSAATAGSELYYTTNEKPLHVDDQIVFTASVGTKIVAGKNYFIRTLTVGSPNSSFTLSETKGGPLFVVGATTLQSTSGPYLSAKVYDPSGTVAAGGSIICDSTADLAVGDKVAFSNMEVLGVKGTSFGELVAGTQYKVSEIPDSTSFKIDTINLTVAVAPSGTTGCDFVKVPATLVGPVPQPPVPFTASTPVTISGVIPRSYMVTELRPQLSSTVTQTVATSNLIVCDVTDIVPGQSVKFTGTLFGGLLLGWIYYVKTVENQACTVSSTVDGPVFALTSATGSMTANFNPLVICNTTTTFAPGDHVSFTKMSIAGNPMTSFGGLFTGTNYTVHTIYSNTSFSVSSADSSAERALGIVAPATNTGCDLIHYRTLAAVANITANVFYANFASGTVILYNDPALTDPATAPDAHTEPGTGTIVVPIGTRYVVTPIPRGTYNPVTHEYVIHPTSPPGTTGTPNVTGSTFGTVAPTGAATEPGSFAGNPYQNLIPPELNTNLGSSTLLPSVPSVQQAVDELIKCNCDSWAVV